ILLWCEKGPPHTIALARREVAGRVSLRDRAWRIGAIVRRRSLATARVARALAARRRWFQTTRGPPPRQLASGAPRRRRGAACPQPRAAQRTRGDRPAALG